MIAEENCTAGWKWVWGPALDFLFRYSLFCKLGYNHINRIRKIKMIISNGIHENWSIQVTRLNFGMIVACSSDMCNINHSASLSGNVLIYSIYSNSDGPSLRPFYVWHDTFLALESKRALETHIKFVCVYQFWTTFSEHWPLITICRDRNVYHIACAAVS